MDLVYPGKVHERRIKINVKGNMPDLFGRIKINVKGNTPDLFGRISLLGAGHSYSSWLLSNTDGE